MKFKTIWGDMEVNSVTPAEPKKDEEVETPPAPGTEDTPPEPPKKDEDTPPTPPTKETEEEEGTEGATPPEPPKKDEDPEDEYEFTEDDVSKAYTMLLDEDVLELDEDAEFDSTPAGLADAVAATVRKKLADEISAIPPVVQQFYAHVMDGKNPKEFEVPIESNWGEMLQTDEANQKAAYAEFLRRQNVEESAIADEVADAVERGVLDKKASVAFSSLISQQEKLDQARAEREKKVQKEAEDKRKQEIEQLNKTIDDMDEFAGFKLDDKKKSAFKDYLFKQNPRDGKTQMQKNMNDADRRLRLAFLDFMDYNRKDFEKDITTKVTKTRKKRLSRYSDQGTGNKNSSRVVKTKEQANRNKGRIKFPTIFGNQEIEVED